MHTVGVLVVFGVMRPPEASAEAEVCQLYVSVDINENVVRLDVPVNEAHLVNALNSTD